MDFKRLVFAASNTFDNSIFMAVGCPIILLICSVYFENKISLIGIVLITLAAALTIGNVCYWLKFYYRMYNVSKLCITSHRPDPTRLLYALTTRSASIGHEQAFRRLADSLQGIEAFTDNPNAIRYGNILIVANGQDTQEDIEEILREDRNLRGLRWNNNFPVGKGVKGFLGNHGTFYSYSPIQQELITKNGL